VPFLFIFILAFAVSAFAQNWVHYSGQNQVRDVAKTEDGTLWAAFAYGLQERSANGQTKSYMPGNNNLQAADFVQIFALPSSNIIAVSKNGALVRKNKSSKNFETISNSFATQKRNMLQGLGKRAGNILILPFEGAIALFDYSTTNRSVITLTQIGTNSLAEYEIKRIAVKEDSVWVDLGEFVWKRQIIWSEIHKDNFLADPNSWIKAEKKEMPIEEEKPKYAASGSNFLERVKTISISRDGNNAVAWGNDGYNHFSRMRNGEWGEVFLINDFDNDQKNYQTKSLATLGNGNFASGWWGAGVSVFNNDAISWLNSNSTGNICPTEFSNSASGYTLVQGLVPSPNYSGYIFSYVSESKYGLGVVDNNGKNYNCIKSSEASSPVAFSIIARENEAAEWEIYAAWKSSLESGTGGVDFYKVSDPKNFQPILNEKWALSFGMPIDFAFDSKGVLWAVSSSKIFYLDEKENEWKEPSYIRGFNGGVISALEADAQNGLWIATLGEGAYSFSQKTQDSLTAKNFKTKDGLLNETVYDIAIDTIKGLVYFAHDFGLSVFSTPLVRNASDYMQSGSPKVIAYPNPFRPNMHSNVTIDHVNEKSSVYILDSSGKRVRFFRREDLRGGAVVWDGKNESGKLVAPGLYHYIASDGKNTAKGKIIIER